MVSAPIFSDVKAWFQLVIFFLMFAPAHAHGLASQTEQSPKQVSVEKHMLLDDGSIAAPGVIEIVYPGPEIPAELKDILGTYKVPCPVGSELRSGSERIYSLHCNVRSGHEWFWMKVLKQYAVVKQVSRVRDISLSVGDLLIPYHRRPSPTAAMKMEHNSSEKILDHVLHLLRKHFEGKAEINELTVSRSYIEVKVSNLRGEVLKAYRYWEELVIRCALLKSDEILLLVDGVFAASLSNDPPPPKSFIDMEGEHYHELSDYVRMMIAALHRGMKAD